MQDFFKAIDADDGSAVTQLLARGFDPNTVDEKGQVGLFLALRGGSGAAAQALLAHPDLKTDKPNHAGETPLMMAALRGSVDWCQRLIERGAQVNRSGWAPLHYAASSPESSVVALLLERGATVDARAPNQSTALMMAASYGHEDSVALLLARHADPKLRNAAQMSAADFARAAGRDALARRIEQAGR